jgi:hypothetical protein
MTDKMQNCRGKSLKREFPEKKKLQQIVPAMCMSSPIYKS